MHNKYIITYECHDNAPRMWKVVQLEKYFDFSMYSNHFSLLSLTSLLSAPEREVTSSLWFQSSGSPEQKMKALFVISTKWDTCLEWITNWHYPELRGYFTLKSLLHRGLKQVMSLFTLGSTRAVLVVALVYSFPDAFNVIMALISPYINQPFIVPIRRTSIVSWDHPSQWRQGL
jgi:hypothetical protein